jgi:hypothetical protein
MTRGGVTADFQELPDELLRSATVSSTLDQDVEMLFRPPHRGPSIARLVQTAAALDRRGSDPGTSINFGIESA